MSDRVEFTCNGAAGRRSTSAPGESLLSVLRERLGIMSVKDGCAPQGQCGCCTVLVDGDARVACVTPVDAGRGRAVVTTVEGLDAAVTRSLADAFVATGGSQCGFCTPGILVRAVGAAREGRDRLAVDVDRALAAHLCRCTGWQTVYDAIDDGRVPAAVHAARSIAPAPRAAELEGGVAQRVGPDVPLGRRRLRRRHRAARCARRGAAPARKLDAEASRPPAIAWVVGESLAEARAAGGQGAGSAHDGRGRARRSRLPPLPEGGVRLATSWVEPAYLEPDASWCAPGGEPASPLANGGAFGGKVDSRRVRRPRELADRFGRTVRVRLLPGGRRAARPEAAADRGESRVTGR